MAVAPGAVVQSQRPSAPLRTTAPAPVAAPSAQGADGAPEAVVPKVLPVTRFAGVELRSRVGAQSTRIVLMSLSISAPPAPVLPPSLVSIVNVMEPAVADTKVGAVLERNVLILASVPLRVMELVPLPVTVTPPPEVAERLPELTLSVVVMVPERASTSTMERPDNGREDPAPAVNDAGNVLTGASLRAFTINEAVSVAVEKAVVPPFVLVSAVPPLVPVVWSHARNVIALAMVPL